MTRQHPHSAQESAPSGQKEVVSMSDPQTLEEAWQRLEYLMDWKEHMKTRTVQDEVDATRALALAAHKAVCLKCFENTGDCAGRRRIEALGK